MSDGVIPQLFEIWRKSVLLTVGAISLGAERLESSLTGWVRTGERTDRAPRVKVPVRAGKAEPRRAHTATRRAPATRHAPIKAAAGARKVRVKAALPQVETTAPHAELRIQGHSAN